jgi:RNA polymerase sigma-70 factor, ECF subfamily
MAFSIEESPRANHLPSNYDAIGDSSAASLSDHHLVLAARSGCRTAFNELWNLYSRRIYKTVFKIMKNKQDAEDALQDSFFRAFLSLESFEGRSSFYSWLTRIAINSALGILRRRRSRPEISHISVFQQEDEGALEELRDWAPDPEQIYDQHQRHAKLMQAIQGLPTILREAVNPRITEGCSMKEVAYRLNISEAAAKARIHRARIRLGSLAAYATDRGPLRLELYASKSPGVQARAWQI